MKKKSTHSLAFNNDNIDSKSLTNSVSAKIEQKSKKLCENNKVFT